MRTIELPEETVTALQSLATAQGISLQEWLEKLANPARAKPRYTLDQLIRQCDTQAPISEETRAWSDAPL